MKPNHMTTLHKAICTAILLALLSLASCSQQIEPGIKIEQITFGPEHHFFGYIGHVQNIPWNGNDRYILSLEAGFQDRMPASKDAADILLLDAQYNYKARRADQTRAWNLQQGTMMYWNPRAQETQFFFNDRDPVTHKIFTVLYDISENERIREFRYPDTPFGNSGVAQNGGYFLGLNYGRLAQLRPVTGYPEAYDWTAGEKHPSNDGIFRVDTGTGESRLLVSFRELRDLLVRDHPDVDAHALFINHTLWNRNDDRIYFYVRGGWGAGQNPALRVNIPCTINTDGTGLTEQKVFIGGHPEWGKGHDILGSHGKRLVVYDTDQQMIVDTLGNEAIFQDPEGDIAFSPDMEWLVCGYHTRSASGNSTRTFNEYTLFRIKDGVWVRSPGFDITGYERGDLRIDGSPCWNRKGSQILFPSLAEDGTRQLFLIHLYQ